LIEPRGLAVAADGALAVADVNLGDVAFFDPEGALSELRIPEDLNQPEAVAWTPNGALVVADTWNHRVLVFDPNTGAARTLPEPDQGWYGPRSVAVASDGTIAVTDTGRKRVVLLGFKDGAPYLEILGGEGSAPGELQEPVGVVWLGRRRLLVCDTANRRLQIFSRDGRFVEEIPLPEAWSDFYSRPQVVALEERQWLVTDVPARSLWLIDDGVAQKIDLTDAGIIPTGLALGENTLFMSDQNGRVWVLTLAPEP
jgi:sugar lactone lactonase YvrE